MLQFCTDKVQRCRILWNYQATRECWLVIAGTLAVIKTPKEKSRSYSVQHTSGHSLMVVAELWAQCNGVTLDLSPLEISSKLSSRCCSTQQCSNFPPLFLQSVTHLIRCRACHLHSHVNSGHWLLLSCCCHLPFYPAAPKLSYVLPSPPANVSLSVTLIHPVFFLLYFVPSAPQHITLCPTPPSLLPHPPPPSPSVDLIPFCPPPSTALFFWPFAPTLNFLTFPKIESGGREPSRATPFSWAYREKVTVWGVSVHFWSVWSGAPGP